MTASLRGGRHPQVVAALPDGTVDLVVTTFLSFVSASTCPPTTLTRRSNWGASRPLSSSSPHARLHRRVAAGAGAARVDRRGDRRQDGGLRWRGGDYAAGGWRDGQPKFGRITGDEVLAKSLYLTPELYRVALAYGVHPLTGAGSPAGKWRVRNVVEWCKPNPTPGDDGDKWRRAHNDIVVACTSARRWWDELATRQPANPNTHARTAQGVDVRPNTTAKAGVADNRDTLGIQHRYASGAPLLDWWVVNKGNYSGAHFATWPTEIPERLIQAMCPRRVCRTCGVPSHGAKRGIDDPTTASTMHSGTTPCRPTTPRCREQRHQGDHRLVVVWLPRYRRHPSRRLPHRPRLATRPRPRSVRGDVHHRDLGVGPRPGRHRHRPRRPQRGSGPRPARHVPRRRGAVRPACPVHPGACRVSVCAALWALTPPGRQLAAARHTCTRLEAALDAERRAHWASVRAMSVRVEVAQARADRAQRDLAAVRADLTRQLDLIEGAP